MTKLSRRKFIQLGGGFTLAVGTSGFWLQSCGKSAQSFSETLNPWVVIRDDNKIIINNPAVEMGQGSMTALPLIVADEMDADWADVIIRDSPIDPAQYGHDGWGSRPMMAIVGSYAVEGYYKTLRLAGAQVRLILRKMAANYWRVQPEDIQTRRGKAFYFPGGKEISFGELISKSPLPEPLPTVRDSDLKSKDQFTLIGKFIPRSDIPSKVNGTAKYSIDINVPDITYTLVQRPPVLGAVVQNYDDTACQSISGFISTIKIDSGLAIVADSYEAAASARKLLKIKWDSPAPSSRYNTADDLESYQQELSSSKASFTELLSRGKIPKRIVPSHVSLSRNYYNDYTYHAQLEPLNAIVHYKQTHATIWIGTQSPDSVLRNAAEQLELPEDKVTVHRLYMGGGFGRRAKRDYLIEACQVAKQIKRPVKLLWTREDDIQHGAFRPNSLQRIEAIVGPDQRINSWDYLVAGPGKALLHTGSETPFYKIPNQRLRALYLDKPSQLCSWRAEGHGHNKFAVEAFVDEVATLIGIDPVRYRKEYLVESPKALEVIYRVEKMSNWNQPSEPGRAKGFSFCERSAITATVCEVSVARDSGIISVHRVWIALDAGLIVQPDNARAQVEGGIIMGISSCLKERIEFGNGKVANSNFHNYPLLRCSEAPEQIDVEFIQSGEPPVGIGEASVPGIGGAIANAFAALTGKRLYQMPFTPDRVKSVLN